MSRCERGEGAHLQPELTRDQVVDDLDPRIGDPDEGGTTVGRVGFACYEPATFELRERFADGGSRAAEPAGEHDGDHRLRGDAQLEQYVQLRGVTAADSNSGSSTRSSAAAAAFSGPTISIDEVSRSGWASSQGTAARSGIELGPLSDAIGRRAVLFAGTTAFTVLSVLCAVAPSVVVLDVVRVLQGVAGAAGLVVARAVITDLFTGPEAARRFAALSVIVFVAPVLAPLVGALVLEFGTWRAVFGVLAGFGAVLVVGVAAWVPETLPRAARHHGGLRTTLPAMAGLLRERAIVGHLVVLASGGAALFAYIAGSAFVFQDVYGMSSTLFGVVFAGNAAAMLVSGAMFGRLAGRVSLSTLLAAGTGVALTGSAVLTGLVVVAWDAAPTTWLCLLLTTAGLGMALPAVTTLIQDLGRRAPGAVSGIVGGAQFVLGAAVAPLTGVAGAASAAPMAAVMLACLLVSAIALLAVSRS